MFVCICPGRARRLSRQTVGLGVLIFVWPLVSLLVDCCQASLHQLSLQRPSSPLQLRLPLLLCRRSFFAVPRACVCVRREPLLCRVLFYWRAESRPSLSSLQDTGTFH